MLEHIEERQHSYQMNFWCADPLHLPIRTVNEIYTTATNLDKTLYNLNSLKQDSVKFIYNRRLTLKLLQIIKKNTNKLQQNYRDDASDAL